MAASSFVLLLCCLRIFPIFILLICCGYTTNPGREKLTYLSVQPKGCSPDIGDHKATISIEKAAEQFIALCVLYENMSWDDPNDSKTLRQIEAVVGKYMNNEEFRQRIESSKNEIAIERFQTEVEEQKQNMSQNMSRGI